MEEVTRNTVYFTCCGEANTGKTLQAACKRCLDLGIRKIVIASETGRSALKAVDVFRGTGVGVIVVTHYPAATWGPRGDIPIGLMRQEYADIRAELVKAGAKIVQGTRPFAPPSRSLNWGYPTPQAGLRLWIAVSCGTTSRASSTPPALAWLCRFPAPLL